MQTLVFDCEIDATRNLVLRLPTTVAPGHHRISVMIDPPALNKAEASITPIPESVAPRTELWSQLAALRQLAEEEGELSQPLSWDGVLAEVERRRGERDD
ncbi:hypothetical protein Thiowin_03259 [Thiorhodovibrio winogradskyi]|uniref:Uncharacterized protein n=1 Tax=Thiorhodovibrio winogradskyi TaxID=77007 RepID=A0ABZ0SB01_9GAMM|nr:hypothetical protein [Thiorhodovibrio winogradskyi]